MMSLGFSWSDYCQQIKHNFVVIIVIMVEFHNIKCLFVNYSIKIVLNRSREFRKAKQKTPYC